MTIIRLIHGDIAKEKGVSSAIVNAANKQLVLGDGVAGALKKACGQRELQRECDEFNREMSKEVKLPTVPTGSLAVTSAYKMAPTKAILHAVAPMCERRGIRTVDQAKQMKSAYESVFAAAERFEFKSLAIPILGAGIYKYPPEESAELALTCAIAKCPSTLIDEIRFVCSDKKLIGHMRTLLGGDSVSINTPSDSLPILASIPQSTAAISGDPSNQADISRCLDFALDINRWTARMKRVQPVPPPPLNQPTPTLPPQPSRNSVIANWSDKTVELQSVKKALKADVDAYLVFAECIEKFTQLDLGPLADTDVRDDLISKLLNSEVNANGWTTVSVPIQLPNNPRPKALICIARQRRDAALNGFVEQLFRSFTDIRVLPTAQKMAIVIPTSCILEGKWRVVWPVFVLFGAWWTCHTTKLDHVILLHETNDLNLAKSALKRKTKFDRTSVNLALASLEGNDGIKLIPNGNNGFEFDFDESVNTLKHCSPSQFSVLLPRRRSVLPPPDVPVTPIRDTDSPRITQIFRDLTTVEQNNPIEMVAPAVEVLEVNSKTVISLGNLGDIVDEEGCIICIPIDNDLILSSTDLAKQLRERCGEDVEEELSEVIKLIDERGLTQEQRDGLIIPLCSHNLRRFRAIFLMVNVDVGFTTRLTDEEKWKLHSSYKKMIEYARLLKCKRLVVTLSSAQSLGFRIEDATAIAFAAVLETCPNEIPSIHFALNAKGARTLLRDKIFASNSNLTVAESSEGELCARLLLPEPLKTCDGFNVDALSLMDVMMNGFLNQSEGVCSQSSQRLEEDSDEFGGTITISTHEEEDSSDPTEGDGRVVFVGRNLELQADLTERAGESYSDTLNNWASDHAKEQGWNCPILGVGATKLTGNFEMRIYQKGISHIVLRNNKSQRPTDLNMREARDGILKSLQLLEEAGAKEVVLNIPTLFFSDRDASLVIMLAVINHINRQTDNQSIRHYRIVGKAGVCLDDLKLWLKTSKEVKGRADVQNLVDRIVKKRSEGNLVQEESGEVNVGIGERRRSRTKEPASVGKQRNYEARRQREVRDTRDLSERQLFYKEDHERRKLKERNDITWEMSEKYKQLKVTPKMKKEFSNALKLLLVMRADPECARVLRRYKYISREAVDVLTSRNKRQQHKNLLAKIWTSLHKRPEFLHHMFSLSIIFKIIKSGRSEKTTIKDTVHHYQFLLDAARELKVVGGKVAEREARKILKQINREVLELEGSTEDENLVRRVGRLRFHICPRGYEGEKVPMVDGIDQLMREWRGVADPVDNSADDVAVDEMDPANAEGIPLQLDVVVEEGEDTAPLESMSRMEVPADENGVSEEEERGDVTEDVEDGDDGREELTTINNRLSTVPRDVMERAQEEVENIVSQEPDMQDHGPALPEVLLPFTTYIHFCDEDKCQKLTADDCRFLIDKVNGYLDLLKDESFVNCNKYFEEAQEGETISALDLLKRLAPCYCGIRSILNRYYKLRSSIRAMRRGHCALKGNRLDQLRMQLNGRMPKEIREIVNQTLSVLYREEQGDFKEGKVRKKYAPMIKKFEAELERGTENKLCKICHTFTSDNDSCSTTNYPVAQFVRDPDVGDVFCTKCTLAIRNKKTNQLRISANGYDTAEIPPELLELNWIEKLLIQRTRSVINTVHLRDKGGRKTNMRGTKGGMVLLPVPTEGTLTHVANTLPSAANLKIIVSSNTKNTVVSMERVIKALRLLKEIHPEYSDVEIDENFELPRDCLVGDGAATVQLIAKDSSDPTLIEHDDITPHVIQEVGGQGKMMKGIAYDHYKLKRNPFYPISLHSANPDTRAFSWLFPDGKFGFHCARPMSEKGSKQEHSERTVARFQLKYKDRRFASDPSFLAFVHGFLEGKTLLSSVGIRARMGKGSMTTANFLRLMEEGNLDFQTSMSTVAAALRGRDAYWVDTKRTLKSHISTFGPPTWFVTLNPAEWDWPDVLEVYKNAYPNEDITSKNIRMWIAKDPFFFARQFQNRLSTVMREVLLKEGGPLGTITHYFHRIEYQQRGTQHVHMLLWAKDAPSKDSTEAEKLAFITKHVTARLPSKTKEPELHRIITTHQTHHKTHSNTCLRVVRYGRKAREILEIVVKKCRFDYPRPAIPAAKFNKAARDLADVPGTFKKAYYLARKEGDEQMINDYNPVMSLLWGANTDVQYVTDLPHIIPYLTSYTSKGESGKSGNAMQESLRSATDNREACRVLNEMLRMRETGSLEMMDLILGHQLHSFDSNHVFINTNKQETRHRMLHSDKELAGKEMAFKDNLYDVYYPQRSEEMEHLSLFQCVTHFTTDKGGPKEDSEPASKYNKEFYHPYGNPYRFQYHHENPHSPFFDFENDPSFPTSRKFPVDGTRDKAFRRLRKPLIARFFFPHLDSANDESREDYYRRLCMAFIPWRDEDKLLSAIPDHSFDSYCEMWQHFTDELKNGSTQEQEALADLDLLMRHHTFLLNAQAETYKNREEMRKRMAALEAEEDPEQGDLLLYARDVNEERMNRNIDAMNDGQRKIFDDVLKGIEMREEYEEEVKRIKKDESLNEDEKMEKLEELQAPEPVRLVVSGTAGTGKSFLINNLADHLTVKYCAEGQSAEKPAVCIAAPTGIAAVQIRGSTIHSLFKIEVQKGASSALVDMDQASLGKNRALLGNVRLFIIDEMSMVSNVLLAKINLRLQEIFSCNEPFAGRNLLLLGDLMQLPPVRASKIFENLQEYEVTKLFGGGVLPTANFFDAFAYSELTENMRQRADKQFGDIMLNARVQALTPVDVENLNSCIIDSESGANRVSMEEAAQFYVNKQTAEVDGDPSILALFATNAEVDTFNGLVMAAREMEIISIPASDSASTKKRGAEGAAAQRDSRSFARPYQAVENDLVDSEEAAVRRKKFSRKKSKGKHAFTDGEDDSNITAGLPKMLRVAINGRVMLRRNISAANGLVNGATGTLKNVERDIHGEIHTLLIQFDGIEDVQTIEKMTAVFDVGLDDQISRTQFPIVSAFAATVHKCQGLTLQNVLISTRSFFAPGMAFVAFSRVTSMKGLHLMDFSEHKVWCDLTSLRKYNSLRESIGLYKFDIPQPRKNKAREITTENVSLSRVEMESTGRDNGIPETPTTSRRRKRAMENADSEDGSLKKRQPTVRHPIRETPKRTRGSLRRTSQIEQDDGMNCRSDVTSTKSSPERKRKAPPVKNVVIDASTPIIAAREAENSCLPENGNKLGYRFVNRGTDCFANTAINSLFCLQSLMEDLMRVPSKNPLVDMMIDVYNEGRERGRRPMENSHRLRDLLYPGNEQDDADEMILKMISNLNVVRVDGSVVQDSFRLHVKMSIPCAGCEEPIRWSSRGITEHTLQIGYVSDVPGTIEELLRARAITESFGPSHAVTGCRVNALDQSKPVEVTSTEMPKYLIVVLEGQTMDFLRTPDGQPVVDDDGNRVITRTHHNIPINGINAKDMRIFGTRYRMKGAAKYKSDANGEISNGHYLFWWKTPANWSIVNDDKYEKNRPRQLPDKCKGMRVLVFERYE